MSRQGISTDELAFEQTWQMLNLPHDGRTLPPDVTIVAVPGTEPPRVLPSIDVGESQREGDDLVTLPAHLGPDLVVIRTLGEGGMGRVLLARQRSLDRDVALKRPHAGASDASARAIRQEALLTGHLEHPNIIPVHALGRDDQGQPLIVMKRVEGVSWRDLLQDDEHPGWSKHEPSLDARLAWHLQTLAQLCNAIAFAHSRGVIHRDIKPDNVMIGEFGEVYQLDWGVAIRAGERACSPDGRPVLVGTPAYMAPEMVRGEAVDQRTDIYLLGATLHEILTRRARHAGQDLYAVTMSAFVSAPVGYSEEIPEELAELANRATARDPEQRPPSVIAFRQALLEHLRHRGSLGLYVAAEERLAEVADAIRQQATELPIERWIEECRIGFMLALRAWPENPRGARGLARSGEALIAVELLRRNAGAARAALDRLADPPDELVAAVAALEVELAAERAERDRLRRLARDIDPDLGARMQLIAPPALILGALLATIAAIRRRFLVNAFNRRLAAWFVLLSVALLLNRLVGVSMGHPASRQHVLDSVLLAVLLATGAIYIFRWVWVCAALVGAGALVGALVPAAGLIAFTVSVLASIAFAIVMQPRRR